MVRPSPVGCGPCPRLSGAGPPACAEEPAERAVPQPEGAAYVFQPQGDAAKYVARVGPEEWADLAQK